MSVKYHKIHNNDNDMSRFHRQPLDPENISGSRRTSQPRDGKNPGSGWHHLFVEERFIRTRGRWRSPPKTMMISGSGVLFSIYLALQAIQLQGVGHRHFQVIPGFAPASIAKSIHQHTNSIKQYQAASPNTSSSRKTQSTSSGLVRHFQGHKERNHDGNASQLDSVELVRSLPSQFGLLGRH